MFNANRIAFVGGGVMGEAMIKGLINGGLTSADPVRRC